MTCPARNQKLTPAACPEHILGIVDGSELLRCRACPRGQALMATVRIGDNFYEPEEGCAPNTEEKPVGKQTYTVKELAALLGVPPKDVANARYAKSKKPVPGTKMAEVRDGMTARGIAWKQVVNERGKKAATEAASVVSGPIEGTAAPAPADKAAPVASEADLAGAVAGMGSDGGPQSLVAKELPLGQAIAREYGEFERSPGVPLRWHGLDSEEPRPIEDLLKDIRQRLPGVEITITLR